MRRLVGSGHRESITSAFATLPAWLADELRSTPFFCGADPIYAGLHAFLDTQDRRSYRDTAHVVYPMHLTNRPLSERVTTVVLPVVKAPSVVLHELGHVLHERLGFPPPPEPVTAYAATDDYEAFAEAFVMAHTPGYAPWAISEERLTRYRRDYPDLAPYFDQEGR